MHHSRISPLCRFAVYLGMTPLLGCPGPLEPNDTDAGTPTGRSTTTGEGQPTTSGGESGQPPADCQQEWDDARAVLDPNCAECHNTGSQNNFTSVLDASAMLRSGRIKPGDPAGSKLYQKLASGEMPKGRPPLSDGDKGLIKAYIECLEPQEADPLAAPNCGSGLHVTHQDALALLRNDILDLPLEVRPRTRYLSLVHLRNAGYCDPVIQTYTHALNKLLNSLSTKNALQPLTTVDDSQGLLLRLDLDDYDIDSGLWRAIACANPFTVDFASNPLLDDDALTIQFETEEVIFVQPGDAFLDLASQGEFYTQILQLPATLAEFEQKVQIDLKQSVADEIKNNKDLLRRAGILESGVADFNRIIEWHDIPGDDDAFCWVSYDFASESGLENIREHPFDFHDHANEIICSLPNGLQFYYIALNGLRADIADPNVVKNVEHEGDLVVNGLSCMGCHQEGTRLATDVIRAHYETKFEDPDLKDQVSKVYAMQEQLNEKLFENQETFKGALAELGVPAAITTSLGAVFDPIFVSDLAFNEPPLDIHRVAAELGVTVEAILGIKFLIEGFDGLSLNGGTIDRSTFKQAFPLAIKALQLGDPAALQSCGG